MAKKRGRKNTSASKGKKSKGKTKKSGKDKAKGKKKGLLGKAVAAGKGLMGLKGGKGGGIGGKARSAKQLLKSAYEKKAKRQIRFGNLGQARKTLRKKITVV